MTDLGDAFKWISFAGHLPHEKIMLAIENI
jgi:hypothetical protein